jgi:hypothetical protein
LEIVVVRPRSHPDLFFRDLGAPLVRDHKYQNNKVEMIDLSIENEQIGQNRGIEGVKSCLIGTKSKKMNEMAIMNAGPCLLAFSPVARCREAGESVSGDVAHGSDEASHCVLLIGRF